LKSNFIEENAMLSQEEVSAEKSNENISAVPVDKSIDPSDKSIVPVDISMVPVDILVNPADKSAVPLDISNNNSDEEKSTESLSSESGSDELNVLIQLDGCDQKLCRITDMNTLEKSDHVAWKRFLPLGVVIWHHAIVYAVSPDDNKLTVIHYSMAPDCFPSRGHFTSVRTDELGVDLEKEHLFKLEYEAGSCLETDEVIARAKGREGETMYNLVTKNCEHFARWCKTGQEVSYQSMAFIERVTLKGQRLFVQRKTGDLATSGCCIVRRAASAVSYPIEFVKTNLVLVGYKILVDGSGKVLGNLKVFGWKRKAIDGANDLLDEPIKKPKLE